MTTNKASPVRDIPPEGTECWATPDNGEPPFLVGTYGRCKEGLYGERGHCIMVSPFCIDCLEKNPNVRKFP